jgi:transketolase
MRLANVIADRLAALSEENQKVWILDADLGDSYGLSELHQQFGSRFIQTGIAEQTLVSLAAGLAACGQKPWAFSFASFLCCRAYDQIRVAISQTNLPVVLVGSHAGGLPGRNGKSHAITNDIAIMSSLPHMDVWAPADPRDTEFVVEQVLASNPPAYIRLPRDSQPALPGSPGLYRWFGVKGGITVVSTGLGTQWAMELRSALSKKHIEVPILHLPKVTFQMKDRIVDELNGVHTIVVVEDHSVVGGLADNLRRELPDKCLISLAWPREWTSASGEASHLREAHSMDVTSLMTVWTDLCS